MASFGFNGLMDEDEEIVEQPLPNILSKPVEGAEAKIENPMVRDYITKLYGEKLSDSARDKIRSENEEDAGSLNWKAGASGLLSALTGRGSESGAETDAVLKSQAAARDKRLSDFDAERMKLVGDEKLGRELRDDAKAQERIARESDPASQESDLARSLAQKMLPSRDFSGMSAADINKILPSLTKIYEIEQKKLDRKEARESKLSSLPPAMEGRTEGQKAVDKDYAKLYNKFTATGRNNAANSIAKMEKLASEMEKDTGIVESGGGGRFSNILPDFARTRDSIRRRDEARNYANTTLKELFGGQLSDAEREAAAKEYYNDGLDNEENAKILRQKIKELRANLTAQDAQSRYYEAHGTLQGFKGPEISPGRGKIVAQHYSPSRNKTKIVYDDGTEEFVDGRPSTSSIAGGAPAPGGGI